MHKTVGFGLLFFVLAIAAMQAASAAPMRVYINAATFEPLTPSQIAIWNAWKENGTVPEAIPKGATVNGNYPIPSWTGGTVYCYLENGERGYSKYNYFTKETQCYQFAKPHGHRVVKK